MDTPTAHGRFSPIRRLLPTVRARPWATAILLVLAVASPLLAYRLPGPQALVVLLVFLPCLFVILAMASAAAVWLEDVQALLAALMAYILVGLALAAAPASWFGPWPEDGWVMAAWPTTVLVDLGFTFGWWPDPGT